jgi:spermidine synthase
MSGNKKNLSLYLKISLFATGLSGIVAEYILSTLASYFLGDSIFQWTMILSLMLFSMGLGSRLSKVFVHNLLEKFIAIEFVLSLCVSFSVSLVYAAASRTEGLWLVIYFLCILVGLMIGMEIPLVMRINQNYEELRVNVANIMEKDYYGSLLGGIFFAFVGLPFLGLTYTPFVLGFVNFSVAVLLSFKMYAVIQPQNRKLVNLSVLAVTILLFAGVFWAKEIVLYGEQSRYRDQVIFSKRSQYQQIVITQWKGNHWLYLNNHLQFSTFDEQMYHEPLVHPVMNLVVNPQKVLILGGGDGCALREVLKYTGIKEIVLVDLDPEMTHLGKNNPILVSANQSAFEDNRVRVVNQDAFKYLEETNEIFDVMIIDFPDPKSIEVNRLYSLEFFKTANFHLQANGALITQAGSPYFAGKAFNCMSKTIAEAGFATAKMHNHIVSMGEWGFIIGHKNSESEKLKAELRSMEFNNISLRWLNREAVLMMTSFGKHITLDENEVEINSIHNPVLYRYYNGGRWDLF